MTNIIQPLLNTRLYHKTIGRLLYHIKLRRYWRTVPQKAETVRAKSEITVLFVITEFGGWKGLPLYQRMLLHPRFRPLLGAVTNPKYPNAKKELVNFFTSENMPFYDMDITPDCIENTHPDIIIYDSPYTTAYPPAIRYYNNLEYLFCGFDYCLSITKHVIHMDKDWYDYCWQFYVEHEEVRQCKQKIAGYRAQNIKVTGVPFQDELMLPKESFKDPWNDKTGKKRIIYAPHHSFKGSNDKGIEFATFMDYNQAMLQFARKYSDRITIAFKPHPFLYIKLLDIWGKERTDAYYNEWATMPNTQYIEGEYVGLFKYSDAIIHDCASFILEYLYMDKPSLYLIAESNNIDDMFDFVKDCYESYEHATTKEAIEQFIQNVISDIDDKSSQRKDCIAKHLTPYGGQTASDNIIQEILNGE